LRSVNNGYWRFEGKPGTTVGTVPNTFQPGHLDGVGEGGITFSADVPYVGILDPVTGALRPNNSSLDMSTGGSRVRVLDDDELDAPAFTIEAFVKIQDQGGYPNAGTGWQLDVDPAEDFRARIDTAAQGNQVVGSGAAQSLADHDWHHVALTFDGNTMRVYVDYANLASRNLNGSKSDVTNVVQDLLFSESTWPAGSYLDEVRFSASVLSPEEFLVATVPEPSTLALAALGGLALAFWGWRASACALPRPPTPVWWGPMGGSSK